jgi:hypothetical protein
MTDKQKYIIDIIEANSEHRFEKSGLSAYNFIGKYMYIYENYKVRQSTRYGIVRLTGMLFDLDDDIGPYLGENPMGYWD